MSVDFMAQRQTDGPDWLIGEPLNVSNANAAKLLEVLGLRPDAEPQGEVLGFLPVYGELCGECEPEAFLGRVLTAQALLDAGTVDSEGTPAVSDGGPGTGRALVVDCGRPAGYLAMRLEALEALAKAAQAAGGMVVWA